MNWQGAFPIDELLRCRNAEGETRVFEVRVEPISDPEGPIFHYLVKPRTPPDTTNELYFAGFHEIEPGLLQIGEMKNPLPPAYQRCGLTRELFALVSARHSATIRSSMTLVKEKEMRSDDATRVWQRMVNDGLARYDATEDRFYYPARRE